MRLLVFPGLLQPAVMDIMHAGPANVRDEERKKKVQNKNKRGEKFPRMKGQKLQTPTLPAALARKDVLGEKKRPTSRALF